MQPASFARTKIRPPRFRRGLIGRSKIERRLGASLKTARPVLLVAPAGYGKTVVLSRQLRELPEGCAAAWVTADAHDNAQRLILCLAGALEPFDPPWRVDPEALAMLASQDGGLRTAAAELINVLSGMPVPHGVIVLDDLHTVADPQVFEFLDRVIDGLPVNWTLAIAARVELLLALSRLRVRRELADFRQRDLSFSEEEVRLLCGALGGDDSAETVRSLHERTRGWPTGLSLSLEARDAPVPAAHRRRLGQQYLFDFLASEVLGQMPQELREFLLRCSVLPELSAERCALVSGNPRASRLLEEIESQGLFLSVLEDEQLTLRLHDLFRDFLSDRLRRQNPDEVPRLLERAAQGESDPMRKVNLLLGAGAWAGAEQVLADVASLMLASGDAAQVIRLIEQFPAEVRETSPQLAYALGLCAWHRYLDTTVQQTMNRAAEGFDKLGQTDEAQHARAFEALALLFLGRFEEARRLSSVVRSRPMDLDTEALTELFGYWDAGFHGPASGAARHLEKLVDLLSATAGADLWYRCMSCAFMFVGRVGVNAQLRRFVRGSLLAAGDEYAPLRAAADIMNAWLLIWRGELAQANEALQRIQEDSKWLGHPESLRLTLLNVQGAYHAMRNDRESVRGVLQALPSAAPHATVARDLLLRSLLVELYLAFLLADAKGMRDVLAAIEATEGSAKRPHLQPALKAFATSCAFESGRPDEAARLLQDVIHVSADVDRMGLDAGIQLLLARIELRRGHLAAAWATLRPTVERIGIAGEIGDVIQSGAELLTELAQAPWGARASRAEIAVLEHWARSARQLRADAGVRPGLGAADGPQLSSREFEVLAEIAAGSSNKVIARKLDLSPHTVKRHVARILERLELPSRIQAAAWYREQRQPQQEP
ncbi:MAG: transcriptional regulator [Variovorax sp.]|nr:MAG: transcriptional regulator [Variovorax sp.]